ncbi:Bug family tripartite tricarboxylate transporter substrate binding protein [Pelagibacterium sediminicola]|uniref:Bug family tripartite tricarboxylate transporter substrate binding protein n=1 Tax=Pelagibacterium sediminicola TaxID=2248761 RepID=UPI0013004185|nr:tripartite tricarboxylate transporter substrate binding protein [Pelagibacterium sediminicola]
MKLIKALLATSVLVLAGSGAAYAQNYPERPVTLVVPFAPGGAVDMVGRFIADRLSAIWGQTIVVENIPGAGTLLATGQVSSASPDGYTLLINSATVTMRAAIQETPLVDPAEDLTHIGRIGATPLLLATSPSLGVSNYDEFAALAKERELKYATVGVGSLNQFASEILRSAADLQMTPVHYNGGSPAMTDVIGGHADLFYGSITQVIPHVREGLMTGIVVSSAERSDILPELPSVGELGLDDAVIENWWGLFGPKGMDEAIVDQINADLNTVLQTPEMAEFLQSDGARPLWGTPEEFTEQVKSEYATWRRVANEQGIRPE